MIRLQSGREAIPPSLPWNVLKLKENMGTMLLLLTLYEAESKFLKVLKILKTHDDDDDDRLLRHPHNSTEGFSSKSLKVHKDYIYYKTSKF